MSIDWIVSLAATKIGEILVEEAKLLYGVEDLVKSLREDLNMMTSFLKDMDDEGADERTRNTIKQIRTLAYDVGDLIESFILENNNSGYKVDNLVKRYVCFCGSIASNHQIGSEIEAIKARIGETMERWKSYLGQNGGFSDSSRVRIRRPISFAHQNEDHIVGLEKDISNLVEVLISGDDEVVSVVGMGGSGKTTLARKLFNNECVKKHFDCLAWVSVSEQWVIRQILVSLLRKAKGESMRKDEVLSFEELVEKVHHCLEGKRYLIVLDDVWMKQTLEEILPTLPTVSEGSKIIVTTRNREVVDFPDLSCFIHEPRRLSEDESWELFRNIALIHNTTTIDMNVFETLGMEMLKKCEGLPLAVVALAGILGKKETVEEWEKVKKAVSSRIMEGGRGTRLYGAVNEMLELSYVDLPRELKPCFLYLAMFREDSEIRVGQLIRLWVAEGFIASDDLHEGDTMEEVARRYLDELIQRCVVQIASKNYRGKVTGIRIHDLVRDLCIRKAKQQDFCEVFTSNPPNSEGRVIESRRTAIYSNDMTYVQLPRKSHNLRSLVYSANSEIEGNQSPSLHLIQPRFRLLRVLLLERIYSSDGTLPAGLGSLIHLKYLGLRFTNITQLPSSIGNLHNLQTLDYRYVQTVGGFIRFPDVIWKLEHLRHLYLSSHQDKTDYTAKNMLRLHTLKYLQTLRGINGGKWMLEELPRLSQSVNKLHIQGISTSAQLDATFQCPSIVLDCLHSLQLDWYSVLPSQEGELVTLKNSKAIAHCQHLRKLSLRGRIEDTLSFPSGIIKLKLDQTCFEEESSLAALGKLPNLAILVLYSGAYRAAKWTCYAGDFPKLKDLSLGFLFQLEEWSIERGAMPQLKSLSISWCRKLSRIPQGLKFVTTLQELHLWFTTDEFKRRIRGNDAHIIQHVPIVQYFQ